MVETRQATKAYYKDFDWICISSAVFSLSVNVPKWDGNGVYRITTDSSVYDQIRIGDLYIIPIHKGALGIEWLDKSEFHPVYNE